MNTPEATSRRRTGRSSDETFLNTLNRRYAVTLGRYETIEQECESVVGVGALLEAQDRVESDKVLMRRVLDAIEVVARHVEPSWQAGAVRPIYPKRRDSATGEIARTAYKVLRREQRPMTARELARGVAEALGREPEEGTLKRFDVAIRSAMDKRIGTSVGRHDGPPMRYLILANVSRNAR